MNEGKAVLDQRPADQYGAGTRRFAAGLPIVFQEYPNAPMRYASKTKTAHNKNKLANVWIKFLFERSLIDTAQAFSHF